MSQDDRTEIRVALVLNGGVSLAVWMSGVVREIDLIRRASCDEGLPEPRTLMERENHAAEQRHYETWRRIAAAKGIRVVVDIIAGTSAGGLNGTIFGMALACNAPLPDLKTMWNEKAALTSDALLSSRDATPRRSVLSGEHFEDTVRDVLTGLLKDRRAEAEPRTVTLFVTATALGRSDLRYRDAADEPFDVADHRRLYRFSTAHLPTFDDVSRTFVRTSRNDFVECTEALVRGARASASYPAAFAPVRETAQLMARRYPPDPTEPTDPPSTPTLPYLMDGGILDNAPIEPVIEEIGRRTPDGRIQRVLAYVVPSNGVVARSADGETGSTTAAPDWVGVVGSALDLPRESDFRHDVTALKDALGADRSRGETSVALLGRAVVWPEVRASLAAGADALLVSYRASRIEGSLREVRDGLAERASGGPILGQAPAGSGMAHRATAAAWAPAPGVDAATVAAASTWPFGFSGARRMVRLLLSAVRMDIDGGRDLVALARDLTEIDAEIRVLEEVVTKRVEARAGNDDSDAVLTGKINVVFAELGVPELLTARMHRAIERYTDQYVLPPGLDVDGLRRILAAIEIVTGAASGNPEEQDPPSFRFVRLGPDVESKLFPDETRGGDKLYGTSLGHFGAFGKAEWRACDYTWGRLDAAAHLAKLIDLSAETTRTLEQEVLHTEGWTSAGEFEDKTHGAGKNFAGTIGLLSRDRAGREVLFGVTRSAVGLLGRQSSSMATTAIRRLFGGAARSSGLAAQEAMNSRYGGNGEPAGAPRGRALKSLT
jgi:predicted acylesterase/phospholipase RssA